MLRRPPTRITLKLEDMDEYDQQIYSARSNDAATAEQVKKRKEADEKAKKDKGRKERIGM
jgi:hypothetical protein